MNVKKILLATAVACVLCGCGDGDLEKRSKNVLNCKDDASLSIINFVKTNNIKIGLNESGSQFTYYSTVDNGISDRELLIEFLGAVANLFETKTNRTKTEITSHSTLQMNNLTFTYIGRISGEDISETAVLLDNKKEVYKSVNGKVKTKLSAQQLLDLLNDNKVKINVLAYAKGSKEKSALFSVELKQK